MQFASMERKHIRAVAMCLSLCASPLALGDEPSGWTPPEVIVVTAKAADAYAASEASVLRTPVPLIEVPQSVQVLTQRLIVEQDLSTLSDAVRNVSGVVPAAPSETVLVNPIVRGFESEIFVDGLIAYGDTAVIDPSSLSGIERIEVAKGPNSLLFGGGSGAPVGGLINIVTKTPTAVASYEVEMRGGSFSTLQPSIDINQPLLDGVALRLTGEYLSSDDAIDEVSIDRTTLNPSLRIEFDENTELLLRYGYNQIKQLEYAGLPAEIRNAPGVDRFHFSGATDAPRTDIDNKMITGVLTHRFSDALSAVLQVRRYDSDFSEYASFQFPAFYPPTGTSYPIIKGYLPAETNEWTVDASVVGQFATGAVEHVAIAGVQSDTTRYNAGLGFDFVPIGAIDFAVNGSGNDVAFGAIPPTQPYRNTYDTRAVYVQDEATFATRYHLLAGLRYAELSINERLGNGNNAYHEVNPRIGAVVDLVDGLSVFADYATGSRLTVFLTSGGAPDPETSESVEGGFKFGMSAIGLTGTIAVYRQTRDHVPTADPLNPFLQVQTGKQRSQGVEADLIWEPNPSWSLLLNYAHTNAEVTKDTTIPDGDALPRVPDDSGRAAVRYRIVNGLFAGAGFGIGVTAASGAEITLPNAIRTDGYTTVDAQASYERGPYRLTVSAENLFDEKYFLPYQYLAQSVVRPGTPRSAYVSIAVRF